MLRILSVYTLYIVQVIACNSHVVPLISVGSSGGGIFFFQEFSWSGELVDGWMPYGPGKATYSNGDSFEGSYDDMKRNGIGKYIYANGAEYEGSYSQNQKTGYGVMKYPDQSVYEGMLQNILPYANVTLASELILAAVIRN